MISRSSLVLVLCLLPFYVSATAYYEVTGPTGEISYQPFFSYPQALSNFSFNPVIFGGGAVAFFVTLFVLYCCRGGGGSFLKTLDFEDEHETEEAPIVAEPAKKNATKPKRARRDVNRYQSRIIMSAQEPGSWA